MKLDTRGKDAEQRSHGNICNIPSLCQSFALVSVQDNGDKSIQLVGMIGKRVSRVLPQKPRGRTLVLACATDKQNTQGSGQRQYSSCSDFGTSNKMFNGISCPSSCGQRIAQVLITSSGSRLFFLTGNSNCRGSINPRCCISAANARARLLVLLYCRPCSVIAFASETVSAQHTAPSKIKNVTKTVPGTVCATSCTCPAMAYGFHENKGCFDVENCSIVYLGVAPLFLTQQPRHCPSRQAARLDLCMALAEATALPPLCATESLLCSSEGLRSPSLVASSSFT